MRKLYSLQKTLALKKHYQRNTRRRALKEDINTLLLVLLICQIWLKTNTTDIQLKMNALEGTHLTNLLGHVLKQVLSQMR